MVALLIVLIIFNVGLASVLLKKWIDSAPAGEPKPKQPRGGEKPINEFFDSNEPPATNAEVREIEEQLLGKIDRKIEVLRELIRQADGRIESMSRTHLILPAERPVAEPDAEPGGTAQRGAARRGVRSDVAHKSDDKRARIVQLHRKGLSPYQIAQEVQMGLGEVELILNVEGLKT